MERHTMMNGYVQSEIDRSVRIRTDKNFILDISEEGERIKLNCRVCSHRKECEQLTFGEHTLTFVDFNVKDHLCLYELAKRLKQKEEEDLNFLYDSLISSVIATSNKVDKVRDYMDIPRIPITAPEYYPINEGGD